MRILFITPIPPMPTWGTAMAFFRHFCERNDFTIEVITDNTQITKFSIPYRYQLVSRGKLFKRLTITRLYKIIYTWSHWIGYWFLPKAVLKQAREFNPDIVLTVAGSWSWMAIMARGVSRELNVPLVGSFNDWWFYNIIRLGWMDPVLEKKFINFYRDCDLALCTSEGMRNALGRHKNAIVFYPTGAHMNLDRVLKMNLESGSKFKLGFGGNLGEWYGKMLERVINEYHGDQIQFSIYGGNPSWNSEFGERVKACGIFHGQVPFKQLQQAMEEQDALILLMGFDKECAQVERTSFKTKFLDYLAFQKPIIVWGPEYCSAVLVARRFDSAEICTSPDVVDFIATVDRLRLNKLRQVELVNNARHMYQQEFHPDKIHKLLKESTSGLIIKRNRDQG